MSDPVALAIIQGIVTIVGSIATIVTTRRRTRKIVESNRREHEETRAALGFEGADTGSFSRPLLPDKPIHRDTHKEP